MSPIVIFFIQFLTFTGVWILIAKQYVWPMLLRYDWKSSATALLLPHIFRVIGLTSLVTSVSSPQLHTGFSLPQAYGDLLAAGLAVIALIAVQWQYKHAKLFVWIFSIVGIVDFQLAAFNAVRFNVFADLSAYWYVPAALVPPLLVSHGLIILLLLRKKTGAK